MGRPLSGRPAPPDIEVYRTFRPDGKTEKAKLQKYGEWRIKNTRPLKRHRGHRNTGHRSTGHQAQGSKAQDIRRRAAKHKTSNAEQQNSRHQTQDSKTQDIKRRAAKLKAAKRRKQPGLLPVHSPFNFLAFLSQLFYTLSAAFSVHAEGFPQSEPGKKYLRLLPESHSSSGPALYALIWFLRLLLNSDTAKTQPSGTE